MQYNNFLIQEIIFIYLIANIIPYIFMAQKVQKSDKDFSQLFSKYQQIKEKQIQQATLFIGYSSSGKTTLCQLIKKFINNENDEGLKLSEKGVYQYENVINQKSLKIGTISPVLYQIKESVFVDVPVLIYQAESKKWNSLDQAVTLSGVFDAFKRVKFVILIDQKFTQTKINMWKKSLQNIVQHISLNQLNDDILNSFSFIITKAAKVNTFAGINRLDSLLQLLLKQSNPQKAQIYRKIITSIKQNKRVLVFNKTKSQQQQNQNNVSEIYNQLLKFPDCQISSSILSQKIKIQQQSRALLNQTYINDLKGILRYWGSAIQWLFKDKNYQKTQNFKDIKIKNYPQINYRTIQIAKKHQTKTYKQSFIASFKNKQKFSNILYASELLFDILELFFSQNQNTSLIKKFIKILEKYGFISHTQKQEQIHKVFLQYSYFEETVGNIIQLNFIQYFQESFKECKNKNLLILMRSFFLDASNQLGQPRQFYIKVLQIIQKYDKQCQFGSVQQSLKSQLLKLSCSMMILDQNDHKRSLNNIFQLYENNKNQLIKNPILLKNFYFYLGKLLMKANKNILAAKFLKKGGHLGLALEAYEKSLLIKQLNKQNDAMEYIDLLVQMFLKEEAIKICFKLAHFITSNQSQEKIYRIIKGQYSKSSQDQKFINIFFMTQKVQDLQKEEEMELQQFINNLSREDQQI